MSFICEQGSHLALVGTEVVELQECYEELDVRSEEGQHVSAAMGFQYWLRGSSALLDSTVTGSWIYTNVTMWSPNVQGWTRSSLSPYLGQHNVSKVWIQHLTEAGKYNAADLKMIIRYQRSPAADSISKWDRAALIHTAMEHLRTLIGAVHLYGEDESLQVEVLSN